MAAWTPAQVHYFTDTLTPDKQRLLNNKARQVPGDVEAEPPVTLSWHNITYTKAGEKAPRLHGVSGILKPRQMVCILGGADAGITSLLHVISGRNQGGVVTGDIRINGQKVWVLFCVNVCLVCVWCVMCCCYVMCLYERFCHELWCLQPNTHSLPALHIITAGRFGEPSRGSGAQRRPAPVHSHHSRNAGVQRPHTSAGRHPRLRQAPARFGCVEAVGAAPRRRHARRL
jgi:hypothetical protein